MSVVLYAGVVTTPRNDQGDRRSVPGDRPRGVLPSPAVPKQAVDLAGDFAEFSGLCACIIGASWLQKNGFGSTRVPGRVPGSCNFTRTAFLMPVRNPAQRCRVA